MYEHLAQIAATLEESAQQDRRVAQASCTTTQLLPASACKHQHATLSLHQLDHYHVAELSEDIDVNDLLERGEVLQNSEPRILPVPLTSGTPAACG